MCRWSHTIAVRLYVWWKAIASFLTLHDHHCEFHHHQHRQHHYHSTAATTIITTAATKTTARCSVSLYVCAMKCVRAHVLRIKKIKLKLIPHVLAIESYTTEHLNWKREFHNRKSATANPNDRATDFLQQISLLLHSLRAKTNNKDEKCGSAKFRQSAQNAITSHDNNKQWNSPIITDYLAN